MAKATSSFQFKHPEVAKKYQPVEVPADFKIRVPQANWPANGDQGWFSEITLEVADQLIKEKYNRLSPVE